MHFGGNSGDYRRLRTRDVARPRSSEIELVLLSGEHSLRKISATHPIAGKCDHIYKMSSAGRGRRWRLAARGQFTVRDRRGWRF